MNDEYLEFAKDTAYEAGLIMKKYFLAEELGLEIKSDSTPVTLADKEINDLVINKVKSRFPEHGVLGEEDSFGLDKQNLWIVDPLDGTINFSRRIPPFAFSMALVLSGKVQIGVVYDPLSERLLWGTKNEGSYENGKRLQVENKIKDSMLIDSWVVGGIENSIIKDKKIYGDVANLYVERGDIQEMDLPVAYALAIVGANSLDATISTIRTQWDVAAGALIATEAGAKVTDIFGEEIDDWSRPVRGILCAAPAIHESLLNTIKPALEEINENHRD